MESYDELIVRALNEDIGIGDITTLATVPAEKEITGRFISKECGVICGVQVMKRIFELVDPGIIININVQDGASVKTGETIAEIKGNARSILAGERVALNFLQRLSGIATKTRELCKELEGTKARVCDTRKTTPGLRALEKYAVRTGGGVNHRFGLFDGVLIKDNHITAAGGIKNAVKAARQNATHMLRIEVETETLDQVREALDAGADVIMLDNMSLDMMREAVKIINHRAIVEASGNMGEKSLKEVAATGVDLISVGALTHTVKALDISLRFEM
ncbi:MAG TPA: carboxylating nicotinate-nucleotide diphosphorylase [Clostridia bacterium]|nr:carboxylating nicotinate-nucleotide diphosphorylase [Clostridia bacterium]